MRVWVGREGGGGEAGADNRTADRRTEREGRTDLTGGCASDLSKLFRRIFIHLDIKQN